MTPRIERWLLACVVACAPRSEREALAGDLLEAAAGRPGALAREALASWPALVGWRVHRMGAARLLLAALVACAAAGAALAAVDASWHAVLACVPRRAGHAMPASWSTVAWMLALDAGVVGACLGASLGRTLRGGRSS